MGLPRQKRSDWHCSPKNAAKCCRQSAKCCATDSDGGPTNRDALERECGDVCHAIWRLIGAGDIDGNGMSQRADDKAKSVVRYLHHQGA